MNTNCIDYKIIILGNTLVGKTSFFRKIISDEFSHKNVSTIGVDQKTLYLDLDIMNNKGEKEKRNFKITLYDTAGQEKFRSVTKSFFKGANGILILYDITNRESFEQVQSWLESIEEMLGENKNDKYFIILFGNKKDLIENDEEKKVEENEAEEKCKEFGFYWGGEISAKTFTKDELINKIKDFVIEIYKKTGINNSGKQVSKNLLITKKKKKKKFC